MGMMRRDFLFAPRTASGLWPSPEATSSGAGGALEKAILARLTRTEASGQQREGYKLSLKQARCGFGARDVFVFSHKVNRIAPLSARATSPGLFGRVDVKRALGVVMKRGTPPPAFGPS
jgi:hypothetical protein